MAGTVRLDVEGPVVAVTNDHPQRHDAFDDDGYRSITDGAKDVIIRGGENLYTTARPDPARSDPR